jgi:hypothetical protein
MNEPEKSKEKPGHYPEGMEWVLETNYGIYPRGIWGVVHPCLNVDAAIERFAFWNAHHPHEYRIYNNKTGETLSWPKELSEEQQAFAARSLHARPILQQRSGRLSDNS